jgi:hypothetical protein
MSRLGLLSLLFLIIEFAACNNDDEDRFEQINKLRAIGVSAVPVTVQPTTSINTPVTADLTIYAVVPLGQTISIEPYTDPQPSILPQLSVGLTSGSEKYVDYTAFRLYSVNARVVIPSSVPIPPKPGFARLKYGVVMRSGDEEEKVIGNLLVYPPGSQELSWQAPSAEIAAPPAGALEAGGSIDLKANLVSPNAGENLRVSWFVSSGKVQNRRAKETKWQDPKTGTQTVMVTVRGLKSGVLGAPKVLDVIVP